MGLLVAQAKRLFVTNFVNYIFVICETKPAWSSTKMSEKKQGGRDRALTQKYDMHSLRTLQKMEEEFLIQLAAIYGCEEDDIPVVIGTTIFMYVGYNCSLIPR